MRRSIAIPLALALAFAACDGPDRAQVTLEPSEPEAPAPDTAGAIAVRMGDGRVSLSCSEAPLPDVLRALAGEAGFQLAPGPLPMRRVSLELEDAPLEDALSRLLAGEAWAAEYVSTGDGHLVARVRVGSPPVTTAAPATAATVAEPPRRGATRPPQPGPDDATLEPWTRGDEEGEMDPELVRRLDSSDARVRAEAVTELETWGAGLERLLVYASADPDPSVRIAAIGEIEGDESYAVVQTLVRSLEDDDAAVVARAVEALGILGDETLLPRIRPLARHRDPRVREAANEAIEQME